MDKSSESQIRFDELVSEELVIDGLEVSSVEELLTVMAQMLGRVQVLRTLAPQAFWPAPKIDSALVRLKRNDRLGADAPKFSTFLHSVFAYRRKTLRKALSQAGLDPTLASQCGFDDKLRPEQFSPQQWLEMFRKSE